jgi:hypothetical protein
VARLEEAEAALNAERPPERQPLTKLVQALHWWAANSASGKRVPDSYFYVLDEAGYLDRSEEGNGEVSLTSEGKAAMRKLGYLDTGYGHWRPKDRSAKEEGP